MNTQTISIVIPTFKKNVCLQNLKKNLPYFNGCEIIIINDNPISSMKQDVKPYRNVSLIENETNLGFAKSVNKGIASAKSQFIILLNDDVLLNDMHYMKALDYFNNDSKLFAVSFAQIEKNTKTVGKNIVYWKKGFVQHQKTEDMKTGFNAWADGGACIIDKQKFDTIEGFSTVYSPFYWEDVDLSYQAYRHGFHVLFDSDIQVVHHHESTIGRLFDKKYIRSVAFRNQLLFIWKNIDDLHLLGEHLLYLAPAVVKGRFPFLKGFFQALLFLPNIVLWKSKHRHLKQVINQVKRKLP